MDFKKQIKAIQKKYYLNTSYGEYLTALVRQMKIIQTRLEEVVEIQPMLINDDRGFFIETYSKKTYSKLGIKGEFAQDNLSHSSYGVLRGLHYQLKNPQGKVVKSRQRKSF